MIKKAVEPVPAFSNPAPMSTDLSPVSSDPTYINKIESKTSHRSRSVPNKNSKIIFLTGNTKIIIEWHDPLSINNARRVNNSHLERNVDGGAMLVASSQTCRHP
jgi:hypothetical protein